MIEKKTSEIVEFYLSKPTYGWIDTQVRIGEKEFFVSFSEVFDPFIDLKIWLEALAMGLKNATLMFENEGDICFFSMKKHIDKFYQIYDDDNYILELSFYKSEEKISGFVNKKQAVSAIYNSVINYSKSSKYQANKYEWEYKTYLDQIEEKSKVKRIYIHELLKSFNRDNLIKFLFELQDENEFLSEEEKEKEFKKYNKNFSIIIPEEKYFPSQKYKFINKLLSKPFNSRAEKLRMFKSKIIEDYLKD